MPPLILGSFVNVVLQPYPHTNLIKPYFKQSKPNNSIQTIAVYLINFNLKQIQNLNSHP